MKELDNNSNLSFEITVLKFFCLKNDSSIWEQLNSIKI